MSATKQFALNYCNLSVNYAGEVQLTAASKSKVLCRVRKCSRMGGMFKWTDKGSQYVVDCYLTPGIKRLLHLGDLLQTLSQWSSLQLY